MGASRSFLSCTYRHFSHSYWQDLATFAIYWSTDERPVDCLQFVHLKFAEQSGSSEFVELHLVLRGSCFEDYTTPLHALFISTVFSSN